MQPTTILVFSDLKDSPRVAKSLPDTLRIGDHLVLDLTVRRKNGGRTEELRVNGEFRVTSSVLDARTTPQRLVSVEALRVAPIWKAVKNPPSWARKMPPARFPRTRVE
jgi:hypothetical protein